MIRAQLRDRVDIRSKLTGSSRPEDMADVRAHVFTLTGAEGSSDPTRPYLLVESLRMIVGPTARPIDPVNDVVTHHGTDYSPDGPPMGRYRNGRIHHWTVNLRRTTG